MSVSSQTATTAAPQAAGLLALLPALAFAAVAAAVSLGAALATPERGEMAVVFSPLVDELTAWSLVQRAGGLLVGPTAFSNIVVAYSPDPGFKQRVRALGALFFAPAKGLCASARSDKGPV